MKKELYYLTINGKSLPVKIGNCRESTVSEMRLLGSNGDYLQLAQYRGELYCIRPAALPGCLLCHACKPVFNVAVDELDAVFAAYFEVRYRGNWFPCFMIGGTDTGVSVVANDPQHISGLGSANSAYMWGSGVEIFQDQIEAVRLWLSDPADPMFFAAE